jgi:DNA-binding beta-propeller fold protein YncE
MKFGLRSMLVSLLLTVALIAGCAKGKLDEPLQKVVWPPPPQQPVIEFVEKVENSGWVKPIAGFKKVWNSFIGTSNKLSGFKKPYGVAVDSNGRVFVTDEGYGRVHVFDREGRSFSWIGAGSGPGALIDPTSITVDSSDHIFVADVKQKRVVEYGPDLKFLRAYGDKGDFTIPGGIAVNEKDDELWVIDVKESLIKVFTLDGTFSHTVGAKGGGDGQFFYPTNLAIDGDRVYVADTLNFGVQVINLQGEYITSWGGNCNFPGCFQRAKGIDVDSNGNVYVVDAAFNNVQIFRPDGQLLLPFAAGGDDDGQLWLPAGLTVDAEDNVWVVSQYNWRINCYKFLGRPTE